MARPVRVADPWFVIPTLDPESTADAARESFEAAGWYLAGTGDWAWVLASPDDTLAARITPFDPAFRLFAEACLAGSPNEFLVRVDGLVPLRHKGYVVLMERLYPVDEARSSRLVEALGSGSGSSSSSGNGGNATTAAPPDRTGELAGHPDIVDLRRRINDLLAVGARHFELWGGADVRPGNILQTSSGDLRLTDPLFVHGPSIVEAIRDGRAEALEDFSRTDLDDFLRIPAFARGSETAALRAAVGELRLTHS